MHPIAVVTAAVASVLLFVLTTTAAQECSVPASTFTFACNDQCNPFEGCWRNSSAAANATQCPTECYNLYTTSQKEFVLLVPLSSEQTSDLAKYIFKSDENLAAIDTLVLPDTVKSASIIGGTWYKKNYIKGRVATVAFANDLLAKQPLVRDVYIASIDLRTAPIATMLPPSIQTIILDNTRLTTFPTALSQLKTLQELSLTNNYITSVDATASIDTISLFAINLNNVSTFNAIYKNATLVALSYNLLIEYPTVLASYPRLETLYLDHNNLTSVDQQHVTESVTKLYLGSNRITKFTAVFPSLTLLDLRTNNLTKLPPAIFKHPKLQILNVANNNMTNITLTNAQAAFLNRLTNFTFDGSVYKDCFVDQQKEVHGTKFCIVASTAAEDADVVDNSGNIGDSTNKNGRGPVGLIVGIACGVVVLLAIGFCMWHRRRMRRERKRSVYQHNTNGTHGTNDNTTVYSNGAVGNSLWHDPALLSVKVDADDIEDVRLLGKGAFAQVWLVLYRKTRHVASKRLKPMTGGAASSANRTQTQAFIDEIKLVATLEHPNIVAFIGAAWTIEADLQALFEYMDAGDVRDWLVNSQTPREWTIAKLQIAVDVAEALVYVHSFQPPLVHRDLKSRNVLLCTRDDERLTAKLTDFGVSRYRSEQETMTAGVGTGRWLAPEVIAGDSNYGAAADIFSFGVVLAELDSHALPYAEVRNANGNKLADVALLQLIASGAQRPHLVSSTCPQELVALADRCVALDPTMRPAAFEVAYALRKVLKSFVAVQ